MIRPASSNPIRRSVASALRDCERINYYARTGAKAPRNTGGMQRIFFLCVFAPVRETLLHIHRVMKFHARRICHRLFCLSLGVLAVAPVSGCTAFQQLSTKNWLDASWFEGDSAKPASQVLTRWDNRVRITENSQAAGAPLTGLAGRVYFFNEDIKKAVDANGFILVQMYDMTEIRPGVPPKKLAVWQFDPHSLKRLKGEDVAGPNYTLFLPWEEYDPAVKKVQLQVSYYPLRGTPYYTNPQMLTLQPDDAPTPTIVGRQITPASHQTPAK